jgi:biopolymer transport protein ExbB
MPSGPSRRAWSLALCSAYLLACLTLVPVPSLFAQEPKADPPAADAAKAEAPAAEAAKGEAPAAAAAAVDNSTPAAKKSLLRWAIEASGPIGLFLLCLSVYFTALVIKLFMELRVSEAVPAALVEKLENAIKERKFQEAYDACRDNDSFLARLVRTGVANLPNGRAEAKEAMNTTQDEVVIMMEARISYLAIIGTLGPMIGLVGTIAGMIASFQEIATAAGAQPKPEKVAEGISTALFITLEGVSLSVPAIFFFALFRNRIALMAMESAKVADRTITALLSAAKQTKPTTA